MEVIYDILYATGQRFSLEGQLVIHHMRDPISKKRHIAPLIKNQTTNVVNVIDPRGIIRSDGRVVYHPRKKGFHHHPILQVWLDEHPEWPSIELGLS